MADGGNRGSVGRRRSVGLRAGMSDETSTTTPSTPAHRYTSDLAQHIELEWQDRWAADGVFDFVSDQDGRGEGVSGFSVACPDSDAILEAAAARGATIEDTSFVIGGVRFFV